MTQGKKSIFDLQEKFPSTGPFGNWMEQRDQDRSEEKAFLNTRITQSEDYFNDFDKSQSQYTTSTYFRDKEKKQYYLVRNVRTMNEKTVNKSTWKEEVFPGSYLPPRAREVKVFDRSVTTEFTRIISETAIFDLDGDLVYIDKDGLPTDNKETGTSSYLREEKRSRTITTTEFYTKETYNLLKTFKHRSQPKTTKVPTEEIETSVDYEQDADWVFLTFSEMLREFDAVNQGHISIHKDYVLNEYYSVEKTMRGVGAIANVIPKVGKMVAGAARTMAGLVAFTARAASTNPQRILLYHYSANPRKMRLKTWTYPTVEADGNIKSNEQHQRVMNSRGAIPTGLLTDPDYLQYVDED